MNKSPMIPSSPVSSALDIHLGFWTNPMRRKNNMRFRRFFSARAKEAEADRYRRYHEAKRKIPMDLPPAEYEAEVKRLAKKFKI